MKCDGICAKWFHLKCSKEECVKFDELKNKTVWYCSVCTIEVSQMIKLCVQNINKPNKVSDDSVNPTLPIVLYQLEEVNANYVKLAQRITEVEQFQHRPSATIGLSQSSTSSLGSSISSDCQVMGLGLVI